MSVESGEEPTDGGEWVLDSLVGYLRSPVWQEPLVKFLEDKSVVFGPEDVPEWQAEFEKVFDEYKELIDGLLERHMNEMDITPEQFEDACQVAEGILSAKLHQNLFEQIWAASDFDTFKRMMIQLNIDLQLHALEVLAGKYGLVPNSFLFEGCSNEDFIKEDPMYHEAVRRSLAEIEPPVHLQKMFEVHRVPDNVSIDETEPKQLSKVEDDEVPSGTGTDLQQTTVKTASTEGVQQTNFTRKFWRPKTPNVSIDEGISADEIRSRQEYLRKQRDRLLDIKKEERKKQLEKMEENAKRPRTGAGRPSSRSVSRVSSVDSKDDPERNLKYRQSLAARIKSEVVDCPDDDQ